MLQHYIRSLKAAPVQRSQEWYEIKKKTIGGSEVATVIGLNPYRSVKSLIAEKVGICPNVFSGNAATRWGVLFEEITKQYTKQILKMPEDIIETGSIEGTISRQRYSPDGLGEVTLLNDLNEIEKYIILFEFKAPLKSIPNGQVPAHYMPQLQTGLLTCEIADAGIFVNNAYRKCSLQDYYDNDYHKDSTLLTTNYAQGLIFIYEAASAMNECGIDVMDQFDTQLSLSDYDFGQAPYDIFNKLLEQIESKQVLIEYGPLVLNPAETNKLPFIRTHHLEAQPPINQFSAAQQISAFKEKCARMNLHYIGCIPYKLMKTDIILVERDLSWFAKINEPIQNTLKTIDYLSSHENPSAEFNALFDAYSKKYTSLKDFAAVDFLNEYLNN